MKWVIENMTLIESVVQSVWYLLFVASAIVLIIIGINVEEVLATILGIGGLLIVLCNETLKAFKTLKR